ncbi:urease accessory protein UreD [Palleronia abyssalis]|uniref:Urease accessory protein UreD n=1 Tax=Palleronia abyssalis TaxID=1501240 RepID=A0A2R8BTP2_9RHOB|nr:urease accessory protein UreD [Palleronia abyssalis]SPJ23503.1 Urease accessory protein UreD [Palleronia abyssalis]
MTTATLERSRGDGRISAKRIGAQSRLATLRQDGSARIGLPRAHGGVQGVLINTSGGMTSGDRMRWQADATSGAQLTLTTQACERIYRCNDGPAETTVRLSAASGAHLAWLPQETLLYDRAQYRRRIEVDLAPDAQFLLVEPLLFGRLAMGEAVRRASMRDDWRIRRDGVLIHAEALRFHSDDVPNLLGGNMAYATVIFISAQTEGMLPIARRIIAHSGGASAIGDKLICRLVAPDGYELRKRLVPLIAALHFDRDVPRLWML